MLIIIFQNKKSNSESFSLFSIKPHQLKTIRADTKLKHQIVFENCLFLIAFTKTCFFSLEFKL